MGLVSNVSTLQTATQPLNRLFVQLILAGPAPKIPTAYNPNEPICSNFACRGCQSDNDCSALNIGANYCNNGPCVECLTDSQCDPNSLQPICASNFTCAGCSQDSDCVALNNGNDYCYDGVCVQCLTSSECYPFICQSEKCTSCQQNSDCSNFQSENAFFCNTTATPVQTCV